MPTPWDPARATPHPHPQCRRGNQASRASGATTRSPAAPARAASSEAGPPQGPRSPPSPRGTFHELGPQRPGLLLWAVRLPPEEGNHLGREAQHGLGAQPQRHSLRSPHAARRSCRQWAAALAPALPGAWPIGLRRLRPAGGAQPMGVLHAESGGRLRPLVRPVGVTSRLCWWAGPGAGWPGFVQASWVGVLASFWARAG